MKTLIFITSIFFVTICYTQNINYGLPSVKKELYTGDLIIVNIPVHVDGRFKRSIELDDLRAFLQFHSEVTFTLSVHIFGGSPEFCLGYSEFLSNDLEKQLNCKNVTIEGKGNEYPLFLDENSVRYFILNSRVEIIIKEKK